MNIQGFSGTDLNQKVKSFTEHEIWGQPSLWQSIFDQFLNEKQTVFSFLQNATSHENLNVILTGAGSSAYIGLSLTGVFKRYFKQNTTAVSTTDIVTHPADCLDPDAPLLMISFARSGNSPESLSAVEIADQLCKNVFHLIITCDETGALAQYKTSSKKYVFVLPAEANDKSLAMTGSYSGMLLTGVLIARIGQLNELQPQVFAIQQYARKLLSLAPDFKKLAELNFDRVVFLGSGPLFGTATESHLKVQELTDGKIICKKDSFLGFRHGPKAVVNGNTLLFMLFSNRPYVLHYETDLIDSLKDGQKPLLIAGLIEYETVKINVDKLFTFSDERNWLDEEFLPVCSILPAQLIGYYKCLQLGLDPDAPSASGAISRVVKGVKIYPYNPANS
jgi:tagatose-6-phosphate ketose/aldose isomerase